MEAASVVIEQQRSQSGKERCNAFDGSESEDGFIDNTAQSGIRVYPEPIIRKAFCFVRLGGVRN